jgi:hypothetical protein
MNRYTRKATLTNLVPRIIFPLKNPAGGAALKSVREVVASAASRSLVSE